MRMGVDVGRSPMGGPAGVADAGFAFDGPGPAGLGQLLDAAALFADLDTFTIKDGKAGGVVAAVFQSSQSIQKDRLGVSGADVGNNSAHRALVLHFYVDRVNE